MTGIVVVSTANGSRNSEILFSVVTIARRVEEFLSRT
jgi:hypothetical protein